MSALQGASKSSWAIVGAGISGLACANELLKFGISVTLFEKARGVSGRLATRQRKTEQGDDVEFDHGAQYFTARTPLFLSFVQELLGSGKVCHWSGKITAISSDHTLTVVHNPAQDGSLQTQDSVHSQNSPNIRYVGVPGNKFVGKALAEKLQLASTDSSSNTKLLLNTRITNLWRTENRKWNIVDSNERVYENFDGVVITTPSGQAAPLIQEHSQWLYERVASVKMEPCWTVMFSFDEPLPLPFDASFVNMDSSCFSWICRNSSKPQRPAKDSWVLHCSPSFSNKYLERSPEDKQFQHQLLHEFQTLVAPFLPESYQEIRPLFSDLHRWRYASVPKPLKDMSLFDKAARLGVCGDWVGGSRVEGAYMSGIHIADSIRRTLELPSSM